MSVLANTPFETKNKIFNSERRTQIGTTRIANNPNQIYDVEFEGTLGQDKNVGWRFVNSQNFTADYSGHIEGVGTPLIRTIFTYANGVKLVEKSDIMSGQYGGLWWGHTWWFEDKDGNYIDINSKMGKIVTDDPTSPIISHSVEIDGNEYTHLKMYYSPPGYTYGGDESRNADKLSAYGVMFVEKWRAFPIPGEEAPALIGDICDDQVSKYYAYGVSPFFETQEDIDKFYEALEKAGDGTPIRETKPDEDESKPGGGDGDYNPFTDPIGFPDLPITGDSISTGFIRVYNPTAAQLQNLASVLWTDDFYNTIKKIQNDPMEAIISLHSVPYGLVGSSTECKVGNFSTGVTMPAISSQWVTLNLGSIQVPEHWGSALDYSPYCTVDMFLPFVGVVQMQVDDIVGKTIQVKYNTDVISGATVVSVMCGTSVLYTYNTNLIYRHTVSQSSYGPMYQSILGMLGSTASGLASGGIGGAVGGAVGGALNVAMSKHSNVSRGGSIGGATGVLGNFVPYLIIHRPIQSLAGGFKHFKGYPSNITATLGSLSGYTEVESVHLEGLSCTDRERDEIMSLLYNGVIF